MRVLIFHGYLLRGTGSNVYNASLASALAGQGHEVHLLCQDREASALGAGAPGTVEIHTPDIGGLLPVFVRDTYPGFEVKTFAELSEPELDAYLRANIEYVEELTARLGGFDAALANHLVMGPVVLARAGLPYALKVHGSDLSYTVLPDLARFGPYASEACEGAAGILVGSGHIAERLRLAVDDPDTNAKVRLGPPGVDTDLFTPIPRAARRDRLNALAERLRGAGARASDRSDHHPARGDRGPEKPDSRAGSRRDPGSAGRAGRAPDAQGSEVAGPSPAAAPPQPSADTDPHRADPPPKPTSWDRDPLRAAAALEWFAEAPGPRVIFVGKLIVSKGVDLLLAAWPLVHRRHPGARLLIVGFGALEEALVRASEGLARGSVTELGEIAGRGRGLEGAGDAPLEYLRAFLDSVSEDYAEAAARSSGSVRFAGRLEHDEVATPIGASEALVFPSTFPEAFGMVAAEAAAAGALPVSAAHSGALEVSRELAAELPPELGALLSYDLGPGATGAIAQRLDSWLDLPGSRRADAADHLRDAVERLWSWRGVADGVLAAARGELDRLPAPA